MPLAMLAAWASVAHAATASWNANPEPDIAKYLVSYRTESPVCDADGPVVTSNPAITVDVGNVTTALLPFAPGVQYFVVVQAVNTSELKSPCSAEVAFTADAGAPVFTVQPLSRTVLAGTTTALTVAATGTPVPTLQWQISIDAGATWTNLTDTEPYSGVTTATLTVTNSDASLNGAQYRAVASSSAGNVPSDAATLTVNLAPMITTQPTDEAINVGLDGAFSVEVSGFPSPTFQWQVSADNGATWTDVTDSASCAADCYVGATTAILAITGVTEALEGHQYRVWATNGVGIPAVSNWATLNVDPSPTITNQPRDETINAGRDAAFLAGASGSPTPTYQWQVSTDDGVTWTDLVDTVSCTADCYVGATTATLTITNVTAALAGYQYRVVATNGVDSPVISGWATLNVNLAPTIT
jgi:hypothetical protein